MTGAVLRIVGGFELRDGCQTTSMGTGNIWCCPRHLPPPRTRNPCLPQSTERVCSRNAVRCSDLSDDESYSTCHIQKALCDLGLDPGPIDGRGNSNMYPISIRMFKARNGILPENDRITADLLERLGVSGDPRVQQGAQNPRLGAGVGLSAGVTDYFWPIAFSLSSVFLGVAWWKWGRRGR